MPNETETRAAKVAEVLCKSGKFETGQGTCAAICMTQLGEARKDCPHREQVFAELANNILGALDHEYDYRRDPVNQPENIR